MNKKRQLLALQLTSKLKTEFGLYEMEVLINGKKYTYLITSEFATRKIESLVRRHKSGKALKLLKMFSTEGFNEFKEVLCNSKA